MTGIRKVQGMYIRVTEKGSYKIFENDDVEGSAEYTFMRIGRGTRPITSEDNTWTLEKDLYYLTVRMKDTKPGILNFVIIKTGFLSFAQIKAQGLFKKQHLPQDGFMFQNIEGGYDIDGEISMVQLGTQNTDNAGFAVYTLPLDGKEPVLLYLNPGESVTIMTSSLMTAVPARNKTSIQILDSDDRFIKIKNTGKDSDFVILKPDTSKKQRTTPAPALLSKTLQKLTVNKPVYKDYEKNETVQYIVSVDTPGFYSLETTGRLQTSITVRTFIRPFLFSSSEGGSGRNAKLVAYLATGNYLAEVKTGKNSAGRAGLRLRPIQSREGGTVNPGDILRTELSEGEGYTFKLLVTEPGDYTILAESIEASHPVRIEDNDGWLINEGANVQVTIEKSGIYTIRSLPSDVPHRRRFQVIKKSKQIPEVNPEQGIVELPLNNSIEAIWNEREPRTPHRYHIQLPAEADIILSITKEMTYRVLKDKNVITEGIREEKALHLEGGDYTIEVSAIEKENKRPYRIGAFTGWLLPNISQTMVGQTAFFQVSIPEDGIYDIESLSNSDLIAELYDSNGTLLSTNDDRRFDWDFLISSYLTKGLYTLSVSRIFGSSTEAHITITPRLQRDYGTISVPLSTIYKAGREILLFTFTARDTGVYTLSAEHPAVEGISIERENKVLASGITELYIPLVKGKSYRASIIVSSNQEVQVPVSLKMLTALPWDVTKNETSGPEGCFKIEGSDWLSYSFVSTERVLFASEVEKQMKSPSVYPKTLSGGSGWVLLVDKEGRPQKGTVQARIARVNTSALVAVPDEAPIGFLFSGKKDSVTLIRTTAREALVGINLSNEVIAPRTLSKSSVITEGKSVAAIYGSTNMSGIIWNAVHDATNESVQVSVEYYPVTATEKWKDVTTITIPPLSAVQIEAPVEPLDVSLLLAEGVVFLDQRKDQKEVYWANSGNKEEHIHIVGPSIFAINTVDKPLLLRITKENAKTIQHITSKEPWKGFITEKNEFKLESNGTWLFFGEAFSSPPVLCGDDGYIYKATAKSPDLFYINGGPGIVSVEGNGLVQIQIQKTDDPYEHLIATEDSKRLTAIKNKSKGWESGLPLLKVGTNDERGWFLLSVDSPLYVSIHSRDGGFLSLFNRTPIRAFKENNIAISAYIDTGIYPVYWNPLEKNSKLTLETHVLEPFPDDGQGRFIGAGEEHFYSFTVSEDAPVGVGIKAERDECELRLFDTSLNEIARGPLIYRTLKKGKYLTIVGGAKSPMQYIPLLYGNNGTLTDIPEDIKKSYVEEVNE
jgi:hypothetical protein